jgi:hypothetical protein
VYHIVGTRLRGVVVLILMLVVAATAGAVVVGVTLRASARSEDALVDDISSTIVHEVSVAYRWRVQLSIAVGVAAAALLWIVNGGALGAYGLPLLLAPGIGAIAALVALAAVPPICLRSEGRRRQAVLAPRQPWSFGPPWAYILPAVSACAVVGFALVCGLTSARTDDGTWRGLTVTIGGGISTASPYPGWFYGIPIIVMTLVLFTTTIAALWRISSTPLRGTGGQIALDTAIRRELARFVMLLSSGALLVYFGGTLFFAGMAIRNVSQSVIDGQTGAPPWLSSLGAIEVFTGLSMALVGTGLVFAAVAFAVSPLEKRWNLPRLVGTRA